MSGQLRVAVALLLLLLACSEDGASSLELEDLQGYWWLDSWANAQVEWNVMAEGQVSGAAHRPWIRFGDLLEGNGGCNAFRGQDPGYRVAKGRLFPGHVLFTQAACGANGPPWPEMLSEEAIQAFLWDRSEQGFEVMVWNMGQMMEWRDGDMTMSWIKTDRPPPDDPGSLAED